ncbi:MAG: hypothetical protein L0Z07_03480 [Planctomycetes bacterium]|nr:hypothetical protein [Planctomycetota bacterium]
MRTVRRFAVFVGQVIAPQLALSSPRNASGRRLLVAALLAGLCSAAAAQQYRTDPIDDKARMNRTTAQRALKDPASYAADRAKFDEFFTKYYFPAMTRTEPQALEELGKLRYELFARYLWATNSEPLQRDLTGMAFQAMVPIVGSKGQPPYHPAARYNAILVIGQLDDQYAIEAGANRRPPKPLPQANEFLAKVLEAANADKSVPPALMVGALVGLERHAQYRESLPAEAITKMTQEGLKIANRETPIAGVNREVFRWIQLQAARMLARLGAVGPENQVHQALLKLIANQEFGIDNRCAVASQLASIKYEGGKVDGLATANTLFALGRDLSADETRRATEFEDLSIGGIGSARSAYGGEGGYRGGSGGGAFGEAIQFDRRQVLSRVIDLRTGLIAVKPIAPAESQATIDAIVTTMNDVVTAASNKNTIDLDVTRKIQTMVDAIHRTAAPKGAGETAEDEFAAPAAESPTEASAAPAEASPTAPAAENPSAAETPPAVR